MVFRMKMKSRGARTSPIFATCERVSISWSVMLWILRSFTSLTKTFQAEGYVRLLLFGNKGTDFRVGQQEQVAGVQTECVSESDDNLAGRMAFPRFQMADVWDRRFDALSDLFLSEVELSAAFPDDPTKAPSLGTCHFPYSDRAYQRLYVKKSTRELLLVTVRLLARVQINPQTRSVH